MTNAPVWLLDVDGVLNGSRTGWQSTPKSTWVTASDGNRYRLRWAPALIVGINLVQESGLIDVRWATSWINDTTVLERALGLNPLPRAYTAPHGVWHARYKLTAALGVVADGRRLIWTDDDAIPTEGPDREYLDAAGALLIAPTPSRGLRPADWDTIRAYALNEET